MLFMCIFSNFPLLWRIKINVYIVQNCFYQKILYIVTSIMVVEKKANIMMDVLDHFTQT